MGPTEDEHDAAAYEEMERQTLAWIIENGFHLRLQSVEASGQPWHTDVYIRYAAQHFHRIAEALWQRIQQGSADDSAHREIRRRVLVDAAGAVCDFCAGRRTEAGRPPHDLHPVSRTPIRGEGAWVHPAADVGWPACFVYCNAHMIWDMMASEESGTR